MGLPRLSSFCLWLVGISVAHAAPAVFPLLNFLYVSGTALMPGFFFFLPPCVPSSRPFVRFLCRRYVLSRYSAWLVSVKQMSPRGRETFPSFPFFPRLVLTWLFATRLPSASSSRRPSCVKAVPMWESSPCGVSSVRLILRGLVAGRARF